jgi:hypothetical protein
MMQGPESDKALAAEYLDIRDRLGLDNDGFGGEDEETDAEEGEEG